MGNQPTTSWAMIEAAASGDALQRAAFALSYQEVIRAYLRARWKSAVLVERIDDAVQDVFVECFRVNGPLFKVDRGRPGGFRPYFFGVIRNVARRIETRHEARWRASLCSAELDAAVDERADVAAAFEAAWAQAMMRQAAELQQARAQDRGPTAVARVELLRLRFEQGMPIREIASLWGVEAARVHREYAKARHEFKQALLDVVGCHVPCSKQRVEAECRELLAVLHARRSRPGPCRNPVSGVAAPEAG